MQPLLAGLHLVIEVVAVAGRKLEGRSALVKTADVIAIASFPAPLVPGEMTNYFILFPFLLLFIFA